MLSQIYLCASVRAPGIAIPAAIDLGIRISPGRSYQKQKGKMPGHREAPSPQKGDHPLKTGPLSSSPRVPKSAPKSELPVITVKTKSLIVNFLSIEAAVRWFESNRGRQPKPMQCNGSKELPGGLEKPHKHAFDCFVNFLTIF